MKVIFMGTSHFGVPALEALNNEHEVVLVVTKIDKPRGRGKKLSFSPIKEKALELGLEVFQPENINSSESIDILKRYQAQIFVVASYGQILGEEVLNIPQECINIHASILPKLRGAAPINRAIIDGHTHSGISIMKMEKGLDTGPVAAMATVEINGKNDVELHDQLAEMGAKALIELLKPNGNLKFIPQEHNNATYAEKIDKATGKIDFNKMKSQEIINLTKGLYSLGGSYFYYEDKPVKVYDLSFVENTKEEVPGKILDNNKKIVIKTIDGAVELKEIQFPSKKKMDVKSFLAGNSITKGIVVE